MLIITNGDGAVGAMDAASVPGDKLPWRDVLHDGPVPAGLDLEELSDVRAHFIASCGWGRPEEVRHEFASRDGRLRQSLSGAETILWFEHDLYDQLQLWQLLDWFSHQRLEGMRLTLIQDSEFIASGDPARLPARLSERRPVTAGQLALGHRAWAAFTAPEPGALERLLDEDMAELPFLRAAIARLLEEYPDTVAGLGRSERQILRSLVDGALPAGELFRAVQGMEEPAYLGDASFFRYVERLGSGPAPLLRGSVDSVYELTAVGGQVLAGERDWIEMAGIDRWIGGVHLHRRVWRRDGASGALHPGPI